MHKPLEGIRILEWGVYYAGPGATAILSDMGAEVIKLEMTGTGDPFRQIDLSKLEIAGDTNVLFQSANRGKKSITINLTHADGRKIAYDLVAKSDIFLTNVRSSTINKLQMDYSTLSKINTRLIYARVNAYGTRGPDADRGGFDPQGQARSGMMYALGDSEPRVIPGGIVDHSTAIMASYQMVIAVLMRERFGIGQEVDVSLLGSASYLMYIGNLLNLFTGLPLSASEKHPLRNHYRCQDGRWLILRMPDSDWATVCRLLGCASPENDQRFDGLSKGLSDVTEFITVFTQAFAGKPRDEWLRLFNDKNLVICAVNTPAEAFNDPQMVENGYIVDYEHPVMGKVRIPGFPIHLSQAEIKNTLSAPKLGENTSKILHDMLSYSQEEIAELRVRGVI